MIEAVVTLWVGFVIGVMVGVKWANWAAIRMLDDVQRDKGAGE